MKRFILMLLIAAVNVVAWAQTGYYGVEPNTATISADGSTLTINVTGDASLIGANWQFVNTTNLFKGSSEPYNAVSNDETWSDSENYKLRQLDHYDYTEIPDFESTYVIEHQDYTKTFNATAAANLFYNNPWGEQTYIPVEEGATPNTNKIWVSDVESSYYCTRSGEEGSYVYTRLRVDDWDNDTYVTSVTNGEPYKIINNISNGVYYSANGTDGWEAVYNTNRYNEEGTYATRSEVYTYSESLSFDQLKAGAYIKNNSSFIAALKSAINAGTYTTIQFVGDGTIDTDIIRAVMYPKTGDITANQDVLTLDFGGVTASDLVATSFIVPGSEYQRSHMNFHTLTLPKVPTVGEEMIVPSNILTSCAPNTETEFTKVIVPEGYTKIGEEAFKNCATITDVILPSTITKIDNKAFENCSRLVNINSTATRSIVFPENLETIGEYAFTGCSALKSTAADPLEFPASLRYIEAAAFNSLHGITAIKLNEGLVFIGNSAFMLAGYTVAELPNREQKTMEFPSTLMYMGPGCFANRIYDDVYFKSKIAPVAPNGQMIVPYSGGEDNTAFDGFMHMANNGFDPLSDENQYGKNSDDISKGYANRENYENHQVYFTILHFRDDLTMEEAETFTDITRHYQTYRNGDGTFNPNNSYQVGPENEPNTYMYTYYTNMGGAVNVGYEDTYLGLQKVWPSQSQWMRSYIMNANGLKWNGTDTYRPSLTQTQYDLMIKDKFIFNYNGTQFQVTPELLNGGETFTAEEAISYNAGLAGAVKEDDTKEVYSASDAIAYNAELDGHVDAGDTHTYTAEEAIAYNATLDGAVKEGDVKTPATEAVFYDSYEEYQAAFYAEYGYNDYRTETNYNEAMASYNEHPDWYEWALKVKPTPATYYNSSEAISHNTELTGAVKANDQVTYTAETAANYNASLPGAVKAGDTKTTYTAEEAIAYNAELTGAVAAGTSKNFSEYLSLIAYQGTRRFVLADADTKEHPYYPIEIEGGKWWTICVPFNLTKAEVDKFFGANTHVCLFSEVVRNATSDPKHLTLKFQNDVYAHYTEKNASGYAVNFSKTADAATDGQIVIRAHEPYMIYPTKKEHEAGIYVDGIYQVYPYNLVEGSPVPTNVVASDETNYRFVGNYQTQVSAVVDGNVTSAKVRIPQYSYMYAKKKTDANYKFWFNQSTAISWPSNKCVVQNMAKGGGKDDNDNFFTAPALNPVKQTSVFGDWWSDPEEATGLENITIIAGEGEDAGTLIYGINGQLINVGSVKSGNIYIKGGKKYFVK